VDFRCEKKTSIPRSPGLKKVATLFNRSKTPTAQCLIICITYITQAFLLVMCLFINIFLAFSANTPQTLLNSKFKLFIDASFICRNLNKLNSKQADVGCGFCRLLTVCHIHLRPTLYRSVNVCHNRKTCAISWYTLEAQRWEQAVAESGVPHGPRSSNFFVGEPGPLLLHFKFCLNK